MTVSSTLEAKMTGRGSSTTPAQAVEKVAGVEPESEDAEQQLNTLAHWGYGTAWGTARGVLGVLGLSGVPATLAHFGAVWGAQQVLLPSIDVAQPTWTYGGKALATDVWHHAVYACVTGLVYDWLDAR